MLDLNQNLIADRLESCNFSASITKILQIGKEILILGSILIPENRYFRGILSKKHLILHFLKIGFDFGSLQVERNISTEENLQNISKAETSTIMRVIYGQT